MEQVSGQAFPNLNGPLPNSHAAWLLGPQVLLSTTLDRTRMNVFLGHFLPSLFVLAHGDPYGRPFLLSILMLSLFLLLRIISWNNVIVSLLRRILGTLFLSVLGHVLLKGSRKDLCFLDPLGSVALVRMFQMFLVLPRPGWRALPCPHPPHERHFLELPGPCPTRGTEKSSRTH